jgi:predicted TIM-barrel fold metal-dependent hydrolase
MAVPLLIDADSHVTEPADVWTSRVPARYADAVPRVVRNDDGRDVWLLDDVVICTVGATSSAGFPGAPAARPRVFEELHPGSYDAAARLRYMDEAGIWAQVLYPNVGGFGSQQFRNIADPAVQRLCIEAYNDFLHEWASADPRRLVTVCSVPFWDVDASVAEVERAAHLGFRGVLFTGEPQRFGLPTLGDRSWDPLWAAACDAGLPVHFHIGGGEDNIQDLMTPRRTGHGIAGAEAYAATNLFMKNGIHCADLITSGVLARFPSLTFVSVESGIGWVPFVLEVADYTYLGASHADRAAGAAEELLPSELFRRQVYTTFWFEHVAPTHLLDVLPVDNLLFETDFPHVTCLYGNIEETIAANLGHVPPAVRRKLLWENAAGLYGIEAPADEDITRMAGARA